MRFQYYKCLTLIYFFFGVLLFAGTDGTIRGKVQNLLDGSVFVTAQGEKEAMDNFVGWCYKGPPGAIVRKIEKVQGKTEEFNEFRVLC